ncbi:hypothetical protein EV187_1040 [Agromyces ramosus]|uniref:PH (Pleckstrin Homology) domain-containing protein n=1 Tax=Agromyces ramosus TaxID=33879 RepID=A0A4Q7MPH3_9MICO|nr:hypothetical protein [Agromyces ramosus]RZS68609.1 hypothetical protein EV187_1040 [Agromyces ramosus]
MTTNVAPRAVGRVARIVGLSIGILWVLAGSIGFLSAAADPVDLLSRPAPALFLLPGVLLAVRAVMIRVRIDGETLTIVSWWRTYRFTKHEVEELLVEHYSGYINRWADTDIMARNVKIIGVAIAGRDRFFPATAMTSASARRILPDLARALEVAMEVMPQ